MKIIATLYMYNHMVYNQEGSIGSYVDMHNILHYDQLSQRAVHAPGVAGSCGAGGGVW